MFGHTPDVVNIYFKFHRNPFRVSEPLGVEISPIPITLAIGFYNTACTTVQAVTTACTTVQAVIGVVVNKNREA